MKKTLTLTILLITCGAASPALSLEKNPFIPKLPEREIVKPVIPPKEEPEQPPLKGNNPPQKEEPVIPEKIDPPILSITGLIWNSDRPQAIVNEQVVDVGDEIESTKIVAIQKNGIDILFNGRLMTIHP